MPEHCTAPTVHGLRQLETHLPPEQIWPGEQGTAVSQSVQPLASLVQVCTPLPEHCTAPWVHWLVQLETHWPPEQI